MTNRRPLVLVSGRPAEMPTSDLIDPACLPASSGGGSGFRNLLINSRGTINQRGYVSGTATTSANQYTLDRWRVVTSGQLLTFSTSGNIVTMTAPAGGLEQVTESIFVMGGTYTLAWTGTATATVNGTTVANGGTVTIAGGTQTTVRFNGGTVSQPQLELANTASAREVVPDDIELLRCMRYYETTYDPGVAPGTSGTLATSLARYLDATTSYGNMYWSYKTRKRSAPSVVIYSPTTGSSSSIRTDTTDVAAASTRIGTSGALLYVNNVSVSAASGIFAHATASAEL